MAIIRDFIACNGAHVIVRDDCCRDVPPEEMARRRAEYWRVVHKIERAEGMRRYNELRAEGMSDAEIWKKAKDRAWVEARFPLPTQEELTRRLYGRAGGDHAEKTRSGNAALAGAEERRVRPGTV